MTNSNDALFPINKNCFTLIRYLAALEVIIGHCVEHFSLDRTSLAYQIFKYTLGMFPGVPIFFGLSGFLIWASLDRNDDLAVYAKKRIQRIYPELWIAVILCMVSILVLYKEPLNAIQVGLFCVTQSSFLQFWTPDCLRDYGCGTPNGSLWTICTFVQFYIVAWLLHRMVKKCKLGICDPSASKTRCAAFWGVFIASLLCTICYPALQGRIPEILYKLLGQTIFPYFILFLIGILVYEFREKVLPTLVRFWFIPLGLYYIVRLFRIDITGTYINPLSGMLLLLTVFALGYKFNRISIKQDYSYGLYLYHMIVVNILLQTKIFSGVWASLTVIVVSMVVSILSGVFTTRLIIKK